MTSISLCYDRGMNRPKLLLATSNSGKVLELRRILQKLDYELLVPGDLGMRLDVDEHGATFAENATLKAVAYAEAAGVLAMGDDSGIDVEILGGEPGIHSARFRGPGLTDHDRMMRLWQQMEGVPEAQRGCRYVAAIVLAWPTGRTELFEGVCSGTIAQEPVGMEGFGYDPIFFLPDRGMTIAEMSDEDKDAISHRGRAVRQAANLLHRLALSGQVLS